MFCLTWYVMLELTLLISNQMFSLDWCKFCETSWGADCSLVYYFDVIKLYVYWHYYTDGSAIKQYLSLNNIDIVLYGCETWPITLKEHRAYENRVLRRIFIPKRAEVTWQEYKCMMNSLVTSCQQGVSDKQAIWPDWEKRGAYTVLVWNLRGRHQLEDQGTDGRMCMKLHSGNLMGKDCWGNLGTNYRKILILIFSVIGESRYLWNISTYLPD